MCPVAAKRLTKCAAKLHSADVRARIRNKIRRTTYIVFGLICHIWSAPRLPKPKLSRPPNRVDKLCFHRFHKVGQVAERDFTSSVAIRNSSSLNRKSHQRYPPMFCSRKRLERDFRSRLLSDLHDRCIQRGSLPKIRPDWQWKLPG
jgi:hypothetical protein